MRKKDWRSIIPTEHEFKYPLDLNASYHVENLGTSKALFFQGYLHKTKDSSLRVRKTLWLRSQWGQHANPVVERRMTFKKHAAGRLIEVETVISERDFDDLWETCVGRFKKYRYPISIGGVMWEIDCFMELDSEEIYFVQAEVELQEGSPRPERLPDIIQENLLYVPDLTDRRFSSTMLGSSQYARVLYGMLKDGTISAKQPR